MIGPSEQCDLPGTLNEPFLRLTLEIESQTHRVDRPALQSEDISEVRGGIGVVKYTRVRVQETPVSALAQVPQILDTGRRVGAVHEFEGRAGRDDPIYLGIYADAGIAMRGQMDEDTVDDF